MNRAREIKLMPVCSPAETIEELKYQIVILLESYEKQLEDNHDGE